MSMPLAGTCLVAVLLLSGVAFFNGYAKSREREETGSSDCPEAMRRHQRPRPRVQVSPTTSAGWMPARAAERRQAKHVSGPSGALRARGTRAIMLKAGAGRTQV
jgi:hypothetical protein